jgi:hypothetical protein
MKINVYFQGSKDSKKDIFGSQSSLSDIKNSKQALEAIVQRAESISGGVKHIDIKNKKVITKSGRIYTWELVDEI